MEKETSVNIVGKVAFAVQDPALITVDIAGVEKTTAEHNAKLNELNGLKQQNNPQREYDRLVQKHFDLKQWLHSCENRINEAAGQIHLTKERLGKKVEERDKTESPLGKRHCERALENLEFELDDAEAKIKKLRRENHDAVAALRAFEAESLPRLEELRKELHK